MRLTSLTALILYLNSLVDSGKYDDIGIEEVKLHIDDGSILRWLQQRTDIDLSLHVGDPNLTEGFEDFYVNYLQAIYDAYAGNERRKWGVERRGLCLLIAWTNEIVQQGKGWKPNEDVARR